MHIVLLGQTGAGKTTLGILLAERLNVPHVSSGEVARQLAREDPHTAVALEAGKWAPEEAMRRQMQVNLEQADLEHGGWVLDGFPRDMAQLICLMRWTAALPVFIYLEVQTWTVIERLSARDRADDSPDAIARRIRAFDEKTMEVITTLEDGGVLRTIHQADRMTLDDIIHTVEKQVS